MDASLSCIQPIPETLLEIFAAIHQFTTSADFAIWLTNNRFNHSIYENKIEEEKYKRTYQYDYEGHIFFQGKIEVDIKQFSLGTIQAFINQSLLSPENPMFNKVGKTCISRVFVEPYYTVISHGLYKANIAGMVWEIYNLSYISTLYKMKKLSSE